MKAMVILSGGQDSTISLYWAKSLKLFEEIHRSEEHTSELQSH